jgi:protein SCO1/2
MSELTTDRQINRTPLALAIGGMMVVLASIIGYALFPDVQAEAARQAADALPRVFKAPSFQLVDQRDRVVSQDDLKGHVWIVDFIFTNCAGPCWAMSERMADFQKEFAADTSMRFVSVTVDPARDSPARFAEYAKQHGADFDRWLFLTHPDVAMVRSLVSEGFKTVARDSTEAQRADGADTILHSTHFMLVDRKGVVRGIYDGTDADSLEKLVSEARGLIRAGGA